jgi:ferredoxin, 2Fe-2S
MKLTYITHQGHATTLTLAKGDTAMLAAVHHNLDGIEGQCGGLLSCATCHVYVDDAWLAQLPPMSTDEKGMLEFAIAPVKPNSRLSCQIGYTAALDGLVLHLPEQQS